MASIRKRLRTLYYGHGDEAFHGRLILLLIDVALLAFFVATTFMEREPWLLVADYAIGTYLLAEWLARMIASRDRVAYLSQPLSVVDLAVALSLFAPVVTENLMFLRVLRALRLLRSYHVISELRQRHEFFARHEQVIFSATNLLVFVFIVASAVFALQASTNEMIDNYVDALYFTITTLTTTGFGDITLTGESGRLLSVLIMIVGLALFLRLLQAVFRPPKVQFECPDCGLNRHDHDAVHCKHCGRMLHITTSGEES
ncbi:MAG: potassium channel family protein [Candidatus Wenzhouxiangella sp. M2_3B_020]